MKRLHISQYDSPAHWQDIPVRPERVTIPLRQGAGVAAVAVVAPGDHVRKGQAIGEVPDGSLGAHVHASIDGVVAAADSSITIQRAQ